MSRIKTSFAFLLVAGTVLGAHLLRASPAGPCFTSGSVTYQVGSTTAAADYKIKFDSGTAPPDLRISLVDDADMADFVLVDDFDAAARDTCTTAGSLKTVSVVPQSGQAVTTVSLTRDAPADFKLFVRSARFSQQDAAALFAAMWDARRTHSVAENR
jgi:hypothetical protein